MTPVDNADAESPEGRYTQAHISARNVVERCFGALKQRFRCLLKHRTLHYDPVRAGKIVYACCILHNMCMNANLPLPDLEEVERPGNGDNPIRNPPAGIILTRHEKQHLFYFLFRSAKHSY